MVRGQSPAVIAGVTVSACIVAAAGENPPTPAIPLCPGLTIVTSVNQKDGDYESIKTIQSVTGSGVQVKYSVERLVDELLSSGPPKLVKYTLLRSVRRADLESASLYEQQFSTDLPETIPETTAIGTSASVLNALKTNGEAKLGIFIAYSQIKPSLDRNTHPNVYDNQMVATITRVGTAPVMVPVIVNDVPVTLPAIQASGDFFGDKTEFFFLDNPANPLTLKFRFGIGFIKPLTPEAVKECDKFKGGGMPVFLPGVRCDLPNGADRDTLLVIKIESRCAAPGPTPDRSSGSGSGQLPGGAAPAGGSSAASALERALADSGKADVYSIYFSFNSDVIREESEPTLKDIAEVLRRHATWRLGVNGHTDGIGGDQSNLDLSRKRAAAVKDALVKRFGIDPGRLTTSGSGKSQPKDTNDTIEGRARNRRVELTKLG